MRTFALTAKADKETIEKLGFAVNECQAYSPHLVPSDFYFLGRQKGFRLITHLEQQHRKNRGA